MAMLGDRARLAEAQQLLLDLLVRQDEASGLEDWPQVGELEKEIVLARARRDELSRKK